jgi:hypothetical protein
MIAAAARVDLKIIAHLLTGQGAAAALAGRPQPNAFARELWAHA